MSDTKEAIEENIELIDSMITDAKNRGKWLNLLQLRVMKWNMMRVLNAVTQFERMSAATKQNTKQNTK